MRLRRAAVAVMGADGMKEAAAGAVAADIITAAMDGTGAAGSDLMLQ